MKKYKRMWKVDLFLYADTHRDAQELAKRIDNIDDDSTYASVDPDELKFLGKVKTSG